MSEAAAQRKTIAALAAITLFALFLNVFQLRTQPVSQDDFDVAVSAINYMESGQLGPTMWNHPCLRNILVYWALKLFGSGVLGTKGATLALGTLCTPLVGMVALRIFKDRGIALTAALLWACDALVVEFSRQGINDIYLAFFPLAGIYLGYLFRESRNPLWLLGCGTLFGLGLASKWSALFPLAVTGALLLWDAHRDTIGRGGERAARYLQVGVMLTVVPLTIYLLTFLPWFSRGYSVAEWPALQRSMFLETSQHVGYHPKQWDDRDNRAYKWFLVPSLFVDPFMNMDRPDGGVAAIEESVTVVLGVANPLVWLLTIPAVGVLIRRARRERDREAGYLAALFLASYLPLVVSPRPIWLNTALSVLPYAVMAAAYLVLMTARRFPRPQLALGIYLSLVLATAAPLYLLAIGKGMRMPVTREYLSRKYLAQFLQEMPAPAGKWAPAPQHR